MLLMQQRAGTVVTMRLERPGGNSVVVSGVSYSVHGTYVCRYVGIYVCMYVYMQELQYK